MESYRGVGDRFGVNKGTLYIWCKDVCIALGKLAPKYIRWPDRSEYENIASDFAKRCGFPGVIGAIDGSHIPVPPHLSTGTRSSTERGMGACRFRLCVGVIYV